MENEQVAQASAGVDKQCYGPVLADRWLGGVVVDESGVSAERARASRMGPRKAPAGMRALPPMTPPPEASTGE